MIDYLLSREPQYFPQLSIREQLYILWHTPLQRIVEGYLNSEHKPVTKGVYGAHHIDIHGDQTKTEIKYRSKKMYKQMLKTHANSPETYGLTYDKHALGWEYLETFVNWCKTRDVKIIFMPSTLMKHSSYFSEDKEKWFYMHIADEVRQRGWNYVGNPYKYMYEKEHYFNTNFHLIDSGRKHNTTKIIEDLKKYNAF
jgi:hypothetical protein